MKKNRKVLIVTQYFYPEDFKSNDIAFELSKRGYKVDALVGIPNYPEGKYYPRFGVFRKRIELFKGVKIYRVFQTPRTKMAGGMALSLNYLTYALNAMFWTFALAIFKPRYDAIIVHEPSPITQAWPALVLNRLRKVPVYIWVLDIWPDAMSSGGGIRNKKVLALVDGFVKLVYNKSEKILISSRQFEKLIIPKGNYKDKLVYFPNWADDMQSMPILEIPQLPNGFIIMMAGNLGSAQDIYSVLQTALELKDIQEIKWVFIGDGSEKQNIEAFIKEHNLHDIVFTLGRFPFSYMPAFYSKANAMLLTLRSQFPHLKAVVPARLQSYMSAGRPVLAMTDGGSVEIINEAECGYAVPAADFKSFAELIRNKVLADKNAFEQKGKNGRLYFEQNFTKEGCIDNLERIINNE